MSGFVCLELGGLCEHPPGTTLGGAAAGPRCGRRRGAGDTEWGRGRPAGPYRAPCPDCALTWHGVLQQWRSPRRQAHFGAALPPSWQLDRNRRSPRPSPLYGAEARALARVVRKPGPELCEEILPPLTRLVSTRLNWNTDPRK